MNKLSIPILLAVSGLTGLGGVVYGAINSGIFEEKVVVLKEEKKVDLKTFKRVVEAGLKGYFDKGSVNVQQLKKKISSIVLDYEGWEQKAYTDTSEIRGVTYSFGLIDYTSGFRIEYCSDIECLESPDSLNAEVVRVEIFETMSYSKYDASRYESNK